MTSYRHALVVGKFYPPHAGHHYLIRTAGATSERVTVVVLAASTEAILLEDRVAWLRASHAEEANVSVVGITDDVRVDYTDPAIWDAHMALIRAAIERCIALDGVDPRRAAIDAVFSSESYGDELARRLGAVHVCVDPVRHVFPVSGTAVRADVAGNWQFLESPTRAGLALRVVVLGAESTGTTTTAKALTRQLRARGGSWARTQWVPEYGRDHTAARVAAADALSARVGGPKASVDRLVWAAEDFTDIARRQVAMEDRAAAGGSAVLICDTDAFATGVWHERYMDARHPEVERIGESRAHGLYLLTSPRGVPFEDDGIRDGEHLRGWMTDRFIERMEETGRGWILLEGDVDERVSRAVAAVDEALNFGPGRRSSTGGAAESVALVA